MRMGLLVAALVACPAIGEPDADDPDLGPSLAAGRFACEPRKTCGQMASCAEARHAFEVCGDRARDRDGDGVPCEGLCDGG